MVAKAKTERKLAITSEPLRSPEGVLEGINVTANLRDGQKLSYLITPADPQILDHAANSVAKKFREVVAGLEEDAFAEAISELIAAFERGEWSSGRGEGEGAPSGGYLLQALSRMQPSVPAKEFAVILADMTKEEKKALSEREDIAAMIKVVKAEAEAKRAAKAKPVDADVLANASSKLAKFGL